MLGLLRLCCGGAATATATATATAAGRWRLRRGGAQRVASGRVRCFGRACTQRSSEYVCVRALERACVRACVFVRAPVAILLSTLPRDNLLAEQTNHVAGFFAGRPCRPRVGCRRKHWSGVCGAGDGRCRGSRDGTSSFRTARWFVSRTVLWSSHGVCHRATGAAHDADAGSNRAVPRDSGNAGCPGSCGQSSGWSRVSVEGAASHRQGRAEQPQQKPQQVHASPRATFICRAG